MLTKNGFKSKLSIGFHETNKDFHSHSWVEYENNIYHTNAIDLKQIKKINRNCTMSFISGIISYEKNEEHLHKFEKHADNLKNYVFDGTETVKDNDFYLLKHFAGSQKRRSK